MKERPSGFTPSLSALHTLYLLLVLFHLATTAPPDITPAGADSMCNLGCSVSARRMMKQWNQCCMRELRESSASYRSMSNDGFISMLSEAPDGCAVDDCCMSDDDAQRKLLHCVAEEASRHRGAETKRPSPPHRRKRSAVIYPVHLQPGLHKWTSPIRYAISDTFSNAGSYQSLIRSVIAFFESNTCLEFIEESPDSNFNGAFFQGNDSGCYSWVGRAFVDRQPINLGSGCNTFEIIAHEVMHFLGVPHEHSREDRDSHVTVLFDNIPSNLAINFQKETFTWHVSKYDYTSVMHYTYNTFGRSGRTTLRVNDPVYANAIGQMAEVSFHDLFTINQLYCRDTCPLDALDCQHGGYPNPNGCQSCHCPVTYSGVDTECNNLPELDEDVCGPDQFRILSADMQTSTTISKKDFVDSTFLCVWKITAPEGYSLVADSDLFSTGTNQNHCRHHWVEIFPDVDTSGIVPRYCSTVGPTNVLFDHTCIIIVYRSYKSHNGQVNGIELTISIDLNECLGPTDVCGTNADCINNIDSYNCRCRSGFTGDAFIICEDIDECATANVCGANSICSNTEGSYICMCQDGYCDRGSSCTACQSQDSLVAMHNSLREQIGASDMIGLVADVSLQMQIETLNTPCEGFVKGGPDGSVWWYTTRYNSSSSATVQDFGDLTYILKDVYEGTTYDPDNNMCSGQCDKYRRMFYKNYIQMACGAVVCGPETDFYQVAEPSRADGSLLLLVCSYMPALQPSVALYTLGDPCTQCPPYRPACQNNLCVAMAVADSPLNNGAGLSTSDPTTTVTEAETTTPDLETTSIPPEIITTTNDMSDTVDPSTEYVTTTETYSTTTERTSQILTTTTTGQPNTPVGNTPQPAMSPSIGAIIGYAVGALAFIIITVVVAIVACQLCIRRPRLPVPQYRTQSPYFSPRPLMMPQSPRQMMFMRNNNYFGGQPRQVMRI